MDNTIIQQGRFTSTGAAVNLQLRSGVDWMKVYNYSVAAANQTTAVGVEYYWQRGFPRGYGWEYLKSNAAAAANLSQIITSNGFTLIDYDLNSYSDQWGALQSTITAVSSATPPVVTNTGTNGLSAGSVVRLYDVTGVQQFGTYDFTVGYNTLSTTTFSLDYAPTIAAGTTGSFRMKLYDPIFYPRNRSITSITQAANAVVKFSVTHDYKVGQTIRLVVPAAFGMVEMNGLLGTIIAIDTTATTGNTVTLDIDSSTFTAFSFPLTTQTPFTPAEAVPVGENTATALTLNQDILSDATINQAYIGMKLGAGANAPAGVNGNVIYWVAGKSFSVTNL